ncbi:MAG: response regulator [Alphaproteobacteria bacterium]|nr:response regulator [Alphaproteobacteria bacterium]
MVDLNRVNVLIVDDEPFYRTIVSRLLGQLNVREVLEAENGVQAIELLDTHEGRIDLMICDIEMPEMNGFELARKIRYGIVERYRKIPFLMLTGSDTEDNIRKGRIHKIDGFIVKTPSSEDLRSRILMALSKPAAGK